MTIIDSAGVARSFPKPLTISEHTLRAIDAGDLTRREWAMAAGAEPPALQGGPGLRHEVGRPQRADHDHQRLDPADHPAAEVSRSSVWYRASWASTTTIDQLYIIERGVPHYNMVLAVPGHRGAAGEHRGCLRIPSVPLLGQALSVGGLSYDELREQERLILVSAMESVQIHRLGSERLHLGGADRCGHRSGPGLGQDRRPLSSNLTNAGTNGHDYFGIDKSVPEGDPLSGSEA